MQAPVVQFSDTYDLDQNGDIIGEVGKDIQTTKIIQGSHCVVKLCRSKASGTEYVVKMIRSEDNELFVHAEREYRIMLRLAGHPTLVQAIAYIAEKERGRGYLVMERVFGLSILNYVVERAGSNFQEKPSPTKIN